MGLGAGVPIVAIGASDDPQARRLARRIGAQVFFRKPIDGSALVDAVHWALRVEGSAGPAGTSGAPGAGDRTDPSPGGPPPRAGPH
jgi:DNA-binding response OmpR family regulator